MAALQYVDFPGYSALLLRKTLTDLEQPGALLDRLQQWLGGQPGVKYVASKHEFQFETTDHEGNPSIPSKIRFGYIGESNAFLRYQGIEIQFCAFDELTQHCVHPDTEVLTSEGWKPVAEVCVGDKVLSLEKDYTCSYQSVSKTHAYDYVGPLHSTKHRGLGYAVTPNHRMVLEYQNRREWKFCRADELPESPRYPTTQEWIGSSPESKRFELPKGLGHGSNSNSVESVPWNDWCEFLGWYLSEGSCWTRNEAGRNDCVSIRQTKIAPTLDLLMERLPWKASKTEGEGWKIHSRQLVDHLLPLGNTYEKRVPREILDSGVDSLQVFLDAFLLGDGSRDGARGWSVSVANEGLIDDLQEICVKLGIASSKAGWIPNNGGPNNREARRWICHLCIHRSDKLKRRDDKRNQYRFHYSGKVYCLTVPTTGTFMTRYEGRVMWTGNSEDDYRYLFSRLRKNACPIHKTGEGGEPIYDDDCPLCLRQRSLPIRMRSASNPGGPGHAWCKQRFRIGPAIPLKEAAAKGQKFVPYVGKHPNRPFIPSFAKDNPHLNLSEYENMLDELDPTTREQLKHGQWDVSAHARFRRSWARYYSSRGEYVVLGKEGKGSQHHVSTLRIFCVVDPAVTSKYGPGDTENWKKQASYTVISTWGITNDANLVLLDLARFRREAPEVVKTMKRFYLRWRPSHFTVEATGVGAPIAQTAAAQGLPINAIHPRVDKVANSAEAMLRMERGKVWFPETADWLETFEDEIFFWTGSPIETDDQVDVLSNACKEVMWEDPIIYGNPEADGAFSAVLPDQDVPQFIQAYPEILPDPYYRMGLGPMEGFGGWSGGSGNFYGDY